MIELTMVCFTPDCQDSNEKFEALDVAAAYEQARHNGWQIGPRNFALCPTCAAEAKKKAEKE